MANATNEPLRTFATSKNIHRLHRLYVLDRRTVACPSRNTPVWLDALVVGSDHFLSLTAPDMVRSVEIFVGARRDAVEHEKLFRTQRSAEG